jgi:hypothetical protein
MLTPAERRLRSRAAAYALHAQGGTSTRAGTAAFLNRFEHEVDPNGTLPPEERTRRAAFARKAYMARLGLRAMKARRLGLSDGEVARIAELEDLLTEVEGRDSGAAAAKERSDGR